jgi:hypothetical protein
MARIYRADYGDRAYERVRAKLDRESKSKEGDRANGRPQKQSKYPQDQNTQADLNRQLSDTDWFKKFPRADIRLRNIVADDDLGNAAADLLSIVVSRGGRKTFIPRVMQ